MLTRFLNIFSKKKECEKITSVISLSNDISNDISNELSNKKLWKPNDKLYREYNDYINSLDSYKKLNIQLNDLIQKKEKILELIEDSDISSLDKILYNQEILDLSDQITIVNNKISKINQNNNILETWNNYVNEARDFLKLNEMDYYIATKDILCSKNIVYLVRKCRDQITYSVKSNEYEKNIIKLLEDNIDKTSVDTGGNLLNFDSKNSELLLNNNYIQPGNDLYKNNNTYYAYLK